MVVSETMRIVISSKLVRNMSAFKQEVDFWSEPRNVENIFKKKTVMDKSHRKRNHSKTYAEHLPQSDASVTKKKKKKGKELWAVSQP